MRAALGSYMQTSMRYLDKNTSEALPFALFFVNFGYYSSKGPFASIDAAIVAAREAGFESTVLDRKGCAVACYGPMDGARRF